MKQIKFIQRLFIVLTAVLLITCNNMNRREAGRNAAPESETREEPGIDIRSSQEVYEGIMPVVGDSTTQVKVTLTLQPDNRYSEHLEYANREGEVTYNEGTYSREDDVLILQPQTGMKTYYRIEDDKLHSLDENRRPITDPDRHYILDRQPDELVQPYPAP